MSGAMDVDQLLDDLLRREGGFVDHPADRGGSTKFGMTQATLSDWLGRRATVADVRRLDEAIAREIYVARYLAGPRSDTLPPLVQPQVFDMAVNHGPRTAIRLLQRVLVLAGFACDTDGVIGPQTRRVCETAAAEMKGMLVNALSELREQFYHDIVARDPAQRVFLRGWVARARDFRVEGT